MTTANNFIYRIESIASKAVDGGKTKRCLGKRKYCYTVGVFRGHFHLRSYLQHFSKVDSAEYEA